MSRIGRKPIPGPRRRHRLDRARGRPRQRPAGELSRSASTATSRCEQEGDDAPRHAPDRPRRAPRPARADALARGQHGRGRHRRLQEDAGDPGRRLPRRAQGQGPRARARLLAPGPDQGARRASSSRSRSRRASSSRASPSSWSARSPPTSASSARRSPTRARASATRASTSPGRSVSAHERPHPGTAPAQAPPSRPREGARHAERPRISVFRSNRGISAQLIDDDAGPHARRRPVDRGRAARPQADGAGTKAGELLAERAKAAGVERAVFDRGGYQYHGRVKAFAEGVREGGLAV